MHTKDCKRLSRPAHWLLGAFFPLVTACGADGALQETTTQDARVPSAIEPVQARPGDVSGQTGLPDAGQAVPLDAGKTVAPDDGGQVATLDAGPSRAAEAGQERGDRAAAAAVGNDAGSFMDAGPLEAGLPDAMAMPSASDADATTAAVDSAAQEAGGPHVFKVDSKAEWTPSGFRVDAGKCYAVNVKIDDRWLDLDVPADLHGWVDRNDARLILFEPFRRVTARDIGFYQFATCVDRKLDQCFPVNETTTLCPRVSGELFFFVNDVPGFEDNNVGTATVSLQAK